MKKIIPDHKEQNEITVSQFLNTFNFETKLLVQVYKNIVSVAQLTKPNNNVSEYTIGFKELKNSNIWNTCTNGNTFDNTLKTFLERVKSNINDDDSEIEYYIFNNYFDLFDAIYENKWTRSMAQNVDEDEQNG